MSDKNTVFKNNNWPLILMGIAGAHFVLSMAPADSIVFTGLTWLIMVEVVVFYVGMCTAVAGLALDGFEVIAKHHVMKWPLFAVVGFVFMTAMLFLMIAGTHEIMGGDRPSGVFVFLVSTDIANLTNIGEDS